jgi:hypothetical protein
MFFETNKGKNKINFFFEFFEKLALKYFRRRGVEEQKCSKFFLKIENILLYSMLINKSS